MISINEKAPDFTEDVFVDNKIKKLNLNDYNGKWVVLFFYPADFTFVCPTELGELADDYEEIKKLNAEIISISTDTAFVHKAWHDNSETIKKITEVAPKQIKRGPFGEYFEWNHEWFYLLSGDLLWHSFVLSRI